MWGYWLFIVIESLFVHLFLPQDALALNESIYIFLIALNSVILVLLLANLYTHDKNFVVLIIGGFLFRLFLLFWSEYFSHIFTLPNSGADEMTYYYNAMSNLVKGKEFTGYAQFFAWQARIYGLSKVFGKFINVLISISAITILRKILLRMGIGFNVRTITLALACFLPNFAILSALLLRESAIIFLVATSAYYLLLWWHDGLLRHLLLALAASVIGAWLHSGMIAYTLGILCIAVSSHRTTDGHRFVLLRPRTIILSAVTSAAVLLFLVNTDSGLTRYFGNADSLSDIVSIADAYEDGGSAYNANVVSNDSILGFIINTPFRMFYFLFAPVPWDWRGATDAVAFCMSCLFYGYVFFKTVPYIVKRKGHPLIAVFFLIAVLTLMIFGWGVSNSGTALRHRDKMVIHYLILFALIQNEKVMERRQRIKED